MLALVVILTMVASLGLCATASAAGKMELAVQDEALFAAGVDDNGAWHYDLNPAGALKQRQATLLARARQLGATHVRVILYMHRLHSCNPAREAWQQLHDDLVATARANGLRVQITLTGVAAPWGKPCSNVRALGLKPSIAGWRRFVRRWVPYYNKRGVTRFSLWNEPNHGTFLCPTPKGYKSSRGADACANGASKKRTARLYAKLYRTGYSAISSMERRRKVRNVQVLVGELAVGKGTRGHLEAMNFTRKVTRRGLRADGLALHPFQFCTAPESGAASHDPECRSGKAQPAAISQLRDVQDSLRKLARKRHLRTPGKRVVPLYLTSFGYHRREPGRTLSEDLRCGYLPRAFERARVGGARQMGLAQLSEPTNAASQDVSIVDQALNPLPSFVSLQAWAGSRGYATQPAPLATPCDGSVSAPPRFPTRKSYWPIWLGEVPTAVQFTRPGVGNRDQTIFREAERLIDGSRRGQKVRIAMFKLAKPQFADSIIDARKRGVDIRMVMPAHNRVDKKTNKLWPEVRLLDKHMGNRVRWCRSNGTGVGSGGCVGTTGTMHSKFITLEHATTPGGSHRSAVSWMSTANFSGSGDAMWNSAVTTYGDVPLYRKLVQNWDDMYYGRAAPGDYYNRRTGVGFVDSPTGRLGITPSRNIDLIEDELSRVRPVSRACTVRVAQSFFHGRPRVVRQMRRLKAQGCSVQLIVLKGNLGSAALAKLRAGARTGSAPITDIRMIANNHDKFFATYDGGNDYRVSMGSHNVNGSSNYENDEHLWTSISSKAMHSVFAGHFEVMRSRSRPL